MCSNKIVYYSHSFNPKLHSFLSSIIISLLSFNVICCFLESISFALSIDFTFTNIDNMESFLDFTKLITGPFLKEIHDSNAIPIIPSLLGATPNILKNLA